MKGPDAPISRVGERDRLDQDDAVEMGGALFAKCLSEGWLDEARSTTLSVAPIENRTDDHLAVGLLRRFLETAALQDRRVRLFERGGDYAVRTVIERAAHGTPNKTEKCFACASRLKNSPKLRAKLAWTERNRRLFS